MNVRVAQIVAATAALPTFLFASQVGAQAENYPNRPIRFVVANSPGGGLDITARAIGPKLANALGAKDEKGVSVCHTGIVLFLNSLKI